MRAAALSEIFTLMRHGHRHAMSTWRMEERVERLVSQRHGATETPAYFNVRRCSECGWTEMKRINK